MLETTSYTQLPMVELPLRGSCANTTGPVVFVSVGFTAAPSKTYLNFVAPVLTTDVPPDVAVKPVVNVGVTTMEQLYKEAPLTVVFVKVPNVGLGGPVATVNKANSDTPPPNPPVGGVFTAVILN